jgi:hypothetical protein
MERGARAALDTVIGPERLRSVRELHRLEGLATRVRAGKGPVAGRMSRDSTSQRRVGHDPGRDKNQ